MHMTAKPISKLVLILRVATCPADARLSARTTAPAKMPEIPASDFNADIWSVAHIVEMAIHPKNAAGINQLRPKSGSGGRRTHRSTAATANSKISTGTIPFAANKTSIGINAKMMLIIFDEALDITGSIVRIIGAGSFSFGF